MSRWSISFFVLMACALIHWLSGHDPSPYVATAFIAAGLADEEREYMDGSDGDE